MTARRHDPSVESAIREAAPASKRDPWPSRLPLHGPLFDSRYRRHVEHLSNLGPKPIGEFLLQLVGPSDDGRTALIVLLEQYARLSPEAVKAIGADVFPPSIFAVGPT